MKRIVLILSAIIASPAYAGDLWEIVSTSAGPDGKPSPYTQKSCFPRDSMDASKILGDLGNCTFDQKTGDASAMTFSMTCTTSGMPKGLASMKVTGDSKLAGDKFDMRYVIKMAGSEPGEDFNMTGSLEAHKVGQCDERM